MFKSDEIDKLAASLAKFQSKVKNPANTANNPFYKSKYAPLQDILNGVRPLLAENGLSVIQVPGGDGEHITVSTILLHSSGQYIETEPVTLKVDKVTPQGAGSAVTYGRRYALSAVLGIASEDDDDGNAHEKGKPDVTPPKQKPTPKKQVKADKAPVEPEQEIIPDEGGSADPAEKGEKTATSENKKISGMDKNIATLITALGKLEGGDDKIAEIIGEGDVSDIPEKEKFKVMTTLSKAIENINKEKK